MSQIKGKNTKPEIMLRKFLFSKGLRGYRISEKITGKPDIVFTKYKVVVFVDGCFWHKCPKCFREPDTNREFWTKKINRNVRRDKKVNEILTKNGWKVIRLWEHEIKSDINGCYTRVLDELIKRGYKPPLSGKV